MRYDRIEFLRVAFSEGGYRIDFSPDLPIVYQKKDKTKQMLFFGDGSGYPQVQLQHVGKVLSFKVHQIVAVLGGLDVREATHINHIDGDKWNYRLSNLEVISISRNQVHAYKNGLKRGKLGLKDAVEIRRKSSEGISTKMLSVEYGVCIQTINSILRGASWSPEFYGNAGTVRNKLKNGATKLTPDDVRQIRYFRRCGLTLQSIADLFKVNYITISDVLRGRTWGDVV